jgi:formylglycine-generating enzyme required for sulfatase activity
MEVGIRSADRVLMVCSGNYVAKAEERKGGAGYEGMIVTSHVARSTASIKWPAAALASEAQWEYACRVGGTKPFHFGATLSPELANYVAYQQTSDVGSFPANAWGLQDMHGNVLEWCLDRWHPSPAKGPTDGSAWLAPAEEVPKEIQDWRLLRGGSWYNFPEACRSASRLSLPPDFGSDRVGFRVCCLPPGLPS